MNAWLKRCVFNLDLNRESVSEPRTFSGRLFHSLGARYEKCLGKLSPVCHSASFGFHRGHVGLNQLKCGQIMTK